MKALFKSLWPIIWLILTGLIIWYSVKGEDPKQTQEECEARMKVYEKEFK